MKRKFAILLIFIFVFNTCMTMLASADEEVLEDNICSTGSLIMDAEQVLTFKEKTPMIIDVKPNQMFNDRLNAELGITEEGLSSGGLRVVADGDEIITSWDNNATLLMTSETAVYPSKVDNSAETTFPIIKDQGYLGSCVAWSMAYYQLTNNANKVRGTAARSGSSNINSRVYSPNWVYNLGNLGGDTGMYGDYAANVLYTYGCPTISQVPIKTSNTSPVNYLSWYPTASIWESALYNKCDLYYGTVNPDELDTPITAPDSSYLDNIKTLLADGYVVTFETYVNTDSSNYLPVTKTGRTSNNASAYVWTEVREVSDGGHAVTIVGYDDNFKVDINGNGSYQTGEYGAFKIANSWGTNVAKHNNGYVWLSYDALNKVSSVLNSNHSTRTSALRNGDIYYFVKPQKEYRPLLTATVGIRTRYRDNVSLWLGIADAENPSNYYEQKITEASYIDDDGNENDMSEYIAFGSGYGNCALDGTNSNSTGTITVDFTSLLQEFELQENHNYNIYIELRDHSGNTTTINSFTLKDHNTGNTFTSNEIPVSTSSSVGSVTANVAYLSSIRSATKDKTFILTFNSKLNESTVDDTIITVTNSNNDYSSLDLSLDASGEKVYLSRQSGTYVHDFYTINILPELKSKGGNGFTTTFSYPFYIPFH